MPKADPDCPRCLGSGEVRSWGTAHKHAPCPRCFPDAELKPVSLSEYQASRAVGDDVRPLQGVSAPVLKPEDAEMLIDTAKAVVDAATDAKVTIVLPVREARQGYRFFGCHACGRSWRTASRDARSPSKEVCTCGNEEAPEHYELDPEIPLDDMGNLRVLADQVELAVSVAVGGEELALPEAVGVPVDALLSRLKEEPAHSRLSSEVLQVLKEVREGPSCSHCSETVRACGAVSGKRMRCTRPDGHKGAHVACGQAGDVNKHEIETWTDEGAS